MKRKLRNLLGLALLALTVLGLGEKLGLPGRAKERMDQTSDAPKPPVSEVDAAEPSPGVLPSVSVWSSRAECLKRVAQGERLAREPGRARLVAWNVRWFPDGGPGRKASRHPTDVEWLACALAYLDADVVALEEIKTTPRARQQLDALVRRLQQLSPGDYRARFDDCESETIQHVGLFWNAKRVRAEGLRSVAELNPHASACQDSLRPGFAGRLHFPGGLDLVAIAVHLKSGGERRALELRQRSIERLPAVFAETVREFQDDDLLLLGDFNTMGCSHCSPQLPADGELSELSTRLARMQRPLRVLPTEPRCSHYFGGKAGLLDLVVAPTGMRELGARARVVPSGVCAELDCGGLPSPPPAAYRDLSDHCPIVVDLVDRDLD